MLARSIQQEPRRMFFNSIVGCFIFAYSSYWMYLSCGEHWRRAIGAQNLVLLLFEIILTFIALTFLSRRMNKPYYAFALASLIPGMIVCFINRASRYPDFDQLITTFNAGNPTDPTVIAWTSIYTETFLQYDYIISRSSTASMIMFTLQVIWLVIVLFV